MRTFWFHTYTLLLFEHEMKTFNFSVLPNFVVTFVTFVFYAYGQRSVTSQYWNWKLTMFVNNTQILHFLKTNGVFKRFNLFSKILAKGDHFQGCLFQGLGTRSDSVPYFTIQATWAHKPKSGLFGILLLDFNLQCSFTFKDFEHKVDLDQGCLFQGLDELFLALNIFGAN